MSLDHGPNYYGTRVHLYTLIQLLDKGLNKNKNNSSCVQITVSSLAKESKQMHTPSNLFYRLWNLFAC